ncbi:MAG: tetratricopeptide repeat protein [Myxococcota bacterium]|nr:tetratricopeptide repeat protein [Myxococcota bacterium]
MATDTPSKISPPEEAPNPEKQVLPFLIKKIDGSIQEIDGLSELHREILAGKVEVSDAVSRNGDVWISLKQLPEFAPFFSAAARTSSLLGSTSMTLENEVVLSEADPRLSELEVSTLTGRYQSYRLRHHRTVSALVFTVALLLGTLFVAIYRLHTLPAPVQQTENSLTVIRDAQIQRLGYTQSRLLKSLDLLKSLEPSLKHLDEFYESIALIQLSLYDYLQLSRAYNIPLLAPLSLPNQAVYLEGAFLAAMQLTQRTPRNPIGHYILAEFFVRKKKSDDFMREKVRLEAVEATPKLSLLLPDNLTRKNMEKSLKYLEQEPGNFDIRFRIVSDFIRLTKFDEAEKVLKGGHERFPNHPVALALQKRLAMEMTNPKASKKEKSKTAADSPNQEIAIPRTPEKKTDPQPTLQSLLRTAERHRFSDRAKQAIGYYQQAAQLNPNLPEIYVGMGWCWLDLKQDSQASKAFQQAITLREDYPASYFGLAETQNRQGLKKEALQNYEKFVSLSPATEPELPIVRNKIKQLREAQALGDL